MAVINVDVINSAACELDGNTFKLWLYLAMNQEGYKVELSYKRLLEFGIKKDAYDRAVKQLIMSGYLIQAKGNLYFFYDKKLEITTFKSGENQHLLWEKPTSKSGQSPQDNNIRQDNIRYKDNTTSAQSDGQAIVLSSSTEDYQPSEDERRILAHMAKTGFNMLPTEHVHQYSIRQWLNDGADPEHIISAISETMQRAGDPQKAPIEDALSYLNARLAYERN